MSRYHWNHSKVSEERGREGEERKKETRAKLFQVPVLVKKGGSLSIHLTRGPIGPMVKA